MKTVFVEDVAEAFEETSTEWVQFLNTETGEFVSLPDSDFYDGWDEEAEKLAEEIDSSDKYVRLPSQRELREYDIMEDFAERVPNHRKAAILFQALEGRKPFRHFKDAINYLELDKAYYAFRFLSYCVMAVHWCEDNEIPYAYRDKTIKSLPEL